MNKANKDFKTVIKYMEQSQSDRIENDKWRLKFHIMPKIGWLNDPNGLCEYKGEYHIFFQYAPFDAKGGLIFWGHYKTKDFINWKYLEPALYPDEAFDCHGVYSGSTLVENDEIYLYYTGNVRYRGNYDYILNGRGHDTILVYSNDGINFENKKVVINKFPDNMTCHIRDPKVWKENNIYYMVQGARDINDIGQVILFSSYDKQNWEVINYIKYKNPFGYMWECPDIFKLNNTYILLFSPQGIKSDDINYNNVYQSGYCIINGDFKKEYSLCEFNELDRGFDFYAPQTFQDSKGRRILIAWMGLPDIEKFYLNPTVENGWQHNLTLPRELFIKNNKIIQIPIKEIEDLRQEHNQFEMGDLFEDDIYVCYELLIDIIKIENDLEILIKQCIKIIYSLEDNILSFEFIDGGYGRDRRAVKLNNLGNLRIFCDTSCIEIFINNGEEVFTSRFYPNEVQKKFKMYSQNSNIVVDLWKLGKYNYI